MLIKLLLISLIFSVILIYLKKTSEEYFLPVLIVASLIIVSIAFTGIVQVLNIFEDIKNYAGISSDTFILIIKIISISYLIEFCAGTICDIGLNSLAEKVVFAGKIIVFCLVLPTVKNIINLLISIL